MKEQKEKFIDEIYQVIKKKPASLKFDYQDENMAKNISMALTFWAKARSVKLFNEDIWPDFLKKALQHENELIRIIAMTELMPARVWREILWKENIDFMSLECFLRRLSPEQKEAIRLNYFDYKSGQIPRVMKKSLRNKVKIFFGLMSFKKLSKQKKYEENRYISKSAWAYNLLGIDFGFSLYPKGELSDQKITNKSFTRFLSVKEHINDFVVNKENGKYFWMYKTARSNYVVRPGQDVKMKNHVCPGFWATLILHTFFWIVSPLTLVLAAVSAWQFGLSWESLSPALFALPLIIWLFVALLRFLWRGTAKTIRFAIRTLTSVNTDHWAIKILKWAGIGVLVIVVAFIVYKWITWIIEGIIIFFMLSTVLGPLLTTLLFLSLIFYLVMGAAAINDESRLKYKNVPSFIRFLALASVTASLVVLLDRFIVDQILVWIIYLAESLWSWYSSDFFMNTWLIITSLFIISPFFFWRILTASEADFVRMDKIIDFIIKIFIILTVGFILGVWIKSGYINLLTLGHLEVLLISLGIISIASYLLMKSMVNRNNLPIRNAARSIMFQLSRGLKRSDLNKLSNNQKFRKLVMEENEILNDLSTMSLTLFPGTYERWSFIRTVILNASFETMRELIKSQQELISLSMRKEIGYVYTITILMATKNISFKKAKQLTYKLSQEKELKERRKEARVEEMERRFGIFIERIFTPFAFIGKKIYQFFSTLKDLWDFFNKRCPYITEEKEL